MTILNCQQVQKYYGANLVLDNVTLEVKQGDRAGLIGRNGCGKSTLLQLIAGLTAPDGGTIALQKGTRVGYLAQIPAEFEALTVYDVLARGYRDAMQCREAMSGLEQRMAVTGAPDLDAILQQYAELQERFERAGGYEMEARIVQVAAGLRIPEAQFPRTFGTLSGGEKTKVCLASLLIEKPTLLLLDEPTNHLDVNGIEWLETYLKGYDGTCIIVSHDRYFLDQVVTKVIELEDGEAFLYRTDYTGYVKEKEERLLQEFAAYQEQQKKIKKMQETIKQLMEWGRIGGNEKFFRRAASMQKALDRMEKLKRPVLQRKTAEFEAEAAERSGRKVLALQAAVKRFGDRTVLAGADALLLYGDRVALVGENGAGKSTLMKLIVGELAPDEGSVELGARVDIGYLDQQDRPNSKQTVLELFCREAEVTEGEGRRLLAGYLFYGPAVFKSVGSLSGGEWTRLRLALLMRRKPNLLLLDEPTNHLDIASREALEEALEEYTGTVLAISHDRYFINRIARSVWELRDGTITPFVGHYDDYRAKSAELRAASLADRPAPVVPSQVAKPQAAPADRPVSAAGKAADSKRKQQLEQAIRQLEQDIADCSARLDDPAQAANTAQLRNGGSTGKR
ncbi:ribosomal protection-like ABC-F family protein [Gordoniibacillus kamchatkensis]|uniref:ribosomal protection-like ABC-F family protein n=1 Tax=Gordoniibacillus kamchatkensis TaxID=1590651 RepID=UPI000A55ADC3|nr:ABC-F type ribosomal protection protein [Paenibacillus sp. VKM B-2647]